MSLHMNLYDANGDRLVQVALMDVFPDDPEEPYFTDLDIEPYDNGSPEQWRQFFEDLLVVNEAGEILTPDHGEEYLERLATEFRGGQAYYATLVDVPVLVEPPVE
jgi:hypothetical protein